MKTPPALASRLRRAGALSRGLALLLLALAAACSQSDRSPRAPEPRTLDESALSDTDGDALDDAELEALSSLGYLGGGGERSRVRSSTASEGSPEAPAPARKAPDTHSLSELDFRNSQNLSQRANEALDYLGPQALLDSPRHFERGTPKSGSFEAVARRDAQASQRQREMRLAGLLAEEPVGGAIEESVISGPESRKRGEFADGRAFAKAKPGKAQKSAGRRGQAGRLSPAQRFQQERRSLDGLVFQPKTGYWANTYVPGDPVLRWLESRLGDRDRAGLEAFAEKPLRLDAASRQTRQPFDPPGSAALSVFVNADRRGLEQEERILAQVGLQGARRRGGLRPAMSVGIVLDARGTLATEAGSAIRALLDAFLAAKDVGDRFSLSVAGVAGARQVGAEEFRHGPVSLAMSQLFEGGEGQRGRALGLVQALQQTAAQLQRGDDPTAPLGSSMVLLITSQPFGPYTETLVRTAHQSAVAGVPVSVVAVGDGASLEEIERVTLAGQGNRRLLRDPAEAEALVDRELSALARVIARALRLNIRLAPGVKLVEVVGAERLDAAGAEQVRQAEQSIDRRLSRNLGIERDRGEDEDGIQIVIPTFHSGDSHVVLLDVVADGPGPIADVTVRYKDLVYLRNSVARANLTLGREQGPAGPLERNVVKNYLAVRLAAELKQAGRSLLEGGDAAAIAAVRHSRELLESLRAELPGFQNDAELANDSAMLGEYLALLRTPVLDSDEPRRYLADSLQLSGYFKTVPRSASQARIARR